MPTIKQYCEALTKSKGMVMVAAQALGVGHSAVSNMIARNPQVARARDEAREMSLDLTELKLFERIGKGDTAAIIYYLKTQGKSRGYSEQYNISVQLERELERALMVLETVLDETSYRRALEALAEGGDEATKPRRLPN